MSLECIAERFAKLRAMREQLCKKEVSWEEAFEARDWLLSQLKDFQVMLNDETTTREQLKNRVADILCVLEPTGGENDDDNG